MFSLVDRAMSPAKQENDDMPSTITALYEAAERERIPLRTVEDVMAALSQCKGDAARASMRRLLLKHGRITLEARQYLTDNSR
jgi:hypothetical protein